MKKKLLILAALLTIIPFNVKAETLANYVTGLVGNDSSVVADDPDHNPRYIGANPNNYVEFNGESWRIVGVFDGKVKLNRTDPLDNFNNPPVFTFDSSDSSVNGGNGANYWGDSKLMYELNGDYLNSELTDDTLWYSNTYNSKQGVFNHTKVIKADAKKMIADAVWYLGAPNFDGTSTYSMANTTAEQVYNRERSNIIPLLNPGGNLSNDNKDRKTTWTGKVALIYGSDYLYSTSGSDTVSRSECLSTALWRTSYPSCATNSWLTHMHNDWTISPSTSNGRNIYVATIYHGIGSGSTGWPSGMEMRPSLYLKSNVLVTGGTGSKEDPYQLLLGNVITFDSLGGSKVDLQYASPNSKTTKPTDPTKEDNIFKGWYTDPELTNKFNFDDTITSDITLYAKWQFDYKILEGKDQTFADKDLTIKTNGDLTKLEKIKVNDKVVDEKYYELKKGSTILTLKADYLKSLENANYTITFDYSDGSVSTTFKINQETKLASNTTEDTTTTEEIKTTNPKTGDNVMKFIILLGVSIVGFIIIAIVALKKKSKK